MKQYSLSEKLRTLRKESNYTQEEISRMLNIQRQTYCNYENEARTPPIDILATLAEIYHVSLDYLIRGTESTEECRSAASRDIPVKTLVNEFASLSSHKQKEVLEFIQFKKQLPD